MSSFQVILIHSKIFKAQKEHSVILIFYSTERDIKMKLELFVS